MRPILIFVVVGLFPVCHTSAQTKQQNNLLSLESAIQILSRTTSESSVSILPPRVIGQKRNLSLLTSALVKGLSGGTRRVLGPTQIKDCAGNSFDNSAQALAKIAIRCKTDQILFVQLIFSTQTLEFCPRLVDAQGVSILDEAFEIKMDDPLLQTGTKPPKTTTAKRPKANAPACADCLLNAQTQPTKSELENIFEQRRALLVTQPTGRWQISQAGRFIGEWDLAKASQDELLISQLETRIGQLQFKRNLGIGMTVAGFLVSGLAMPMLKSDSEGQLTGGIVVGIGLVSGITGLIFWLVYGDTAKYAGTAQDRTHLLTREQAERLVQQYNRTLRKDLQF